MSLINDTLRDLDRRKDREGWSKPTPPQRGPRRPVTIPRSVVVGLAALGIAVAFAVFFDAERVEGWALTSPYAARTALPDAVGRWLTPDVASPPPVVAQESNPTFNEAPELRGLSIDGDRERVRIELEVAGKLAAEPQPALAGSELLLVLDGVRIGSTLDPMAVSPVDAPWLASLDLLEQAHGLVVRMTFEGEVSFRSRLVRREQGSRIALELATVPVRPRSQALPASRSRVAAASALPRPFDADLPTIPTPVELPPVSAIDASGGSAPDEARIEKTLREPTAAERVARRLVEARRTLAAGEATEAAASLREILAEDPRNEAARALLGRALVARGEVDEAESVLRAGGVRSAERAKLLAGLLARQGRPGEALTVLAGIDPPPVTDADVHALRAASLQELARHTEAVASWRNALRLSPHRADAWMGMAISLEALARPEPARTAYLAALRVGGLGEAPSAWAARRVEALDR